MMDKIVADYEKLGIDHSSNMVITQILNLLNVSDLGVRRQFELFHMELIIDLLRIKSIDHISYKRYIKAINDTKGKMNFWGEKFEVSFHAKLLKAVPQLITNLRRGKDGFEPDLVFEINNCPIGIELTTLKFTSPPKTIDEVLSKITDRISEKNSKKYSSTSTALIIDVTNLYAYGKILKFELNDIFKNYFNGFGHLQKEMKIGAVVLCNSEYKEKENGDLHHILAPKIMLVNEEKEIDSNLIEFLMNRFNNFEPNLGYSKGYQHFFI